MFAWTLLDGSGQELGHSPSFPDTESAEAWIGTSWRDLLENGVEEVALYDRTQERRLYRMGLDAE